MRILLANEARRGGGGVETYLASLVDTLVRRGHDVALLYANPSAEQGPTSVPARDAWSVADEGLDRAITAVRAWHPDVCFSHNMRPLDVDDRLTREWPTVKMMHGYFGACLSGQKAFSFPSLVACTRRCDAGCLAYYLPRRCGQRRPDLMLAQYAWAMRQQRLFPRYAGIVVASDHMRREYLRYGIDGNRVHTIALFAADGASPSPAAPAIDVLFLGRMTPLKGPAALIRASAVAATMVGRPLSVVLAGEGQSRAALDRLARQFEAKRLLAITCPGWVDGDARAALLARATLIAVPSLWPEPFGLVGLEAAQHGVPAVAFDVGGIRGWLEDGVNGRLVEPSGGAAAFGGAIAALLRDGALRGRLAAGARAAAKRLNADAHVTMLEHVLAAAVHQHPCHSVGTS
jgi:glycosyltransferase involved in cell wall biosynthesis